MFYRAVNRVPSMRILVTLILDTLPMLGNVSLLTLLIYTVFGNFSLIGLYEFLAFV